MRWLALAFAAVVLCFIGATAYSQVRASEIRVLSASIARNAMPSIQQLAFAQSELRHLDALVDRYVNANSETREDALKSVLRAQGKVDAAVDAYLRIPVYPGETELFTSIRGKLSGIDQAIATTRALVDASNLELARASAARMTEQFDSASAALQDDIEFNARQGQLIAQHIEKVRRRSLLVALGLGSASVVMTVIVAVLAMRAFGGHAKLLRLHNELLAQRADELEHFAGRVAHDVRNPIGVAVMCFDAVRRLVGNNRKVDDKVERGVSNLRRASTLLDGLLAFARAGARPPPGASANVRSVVESSLEELRLAARDSLVELRCEPLAECTVLCDPSILELLVSNLVRNAIKYIGDGPERKITVRGFDVGAFVRVEVEDTGIGVPRELRDAIFEPFVRGTSARSGTGLGLATVKKICDTHGGRVGVESAVARGSLFWFELPKGTRGRLSSASSAPESGVTNRRA